MMDDPRANIRRDLMNDNLRSLLNRAAEMHGHYCPGLAAGVKAASVACQKLDIVHADGMEEVMAVVECNSCFVDGIQAVAGCTLGNNALVYRDLGKTAATFYQRDAEEGLRLRLRDFNVGRNESQRKEADELFDKAVKRREQLTDDEQERFTHLWRQGALTLLDEPDEEVFAIDTVTTPDISYAPIHDSARCSECGEKVMESRARLCHGQPVCLTCADQPHLMVTGSGITFSS